MGQITSECITINDNLPTYRPCVKKRSVRFEKNVKVILIPSREEYAAAGLLNVLWYLNIFICIYKYFNYRIEAKT